MFALILNENVIQLSEIKFPVHDSLVWVDAVGDIKVGQKYVDSKYIPPEPPKEPTYIENRESEYPPKDQLIIALWEAYVENRPESMQAIQVKRLEVKAKYPKPVSK